VKTLLVFLMLVTSALATPCQDARKDYERARRYGAFDFKCRDRYDGTATSSWRMEMDDYKRFRDSECRRRMRKK
jgi:hypothetical protein